MENNYRILIAEDEPKLSQVMQEELIQHGYQADVAYDGAVAENCLSNMLIPWYCLTLIFLIKTGLRSAKNSGNKTAKCLSSC